MALGPSLTQILGYSAMQDSPTLVSSQNPGLGSLFGFGTKDPNRSIIASSNAGSLNPQPQDVDAAIGGALATKTMTPQSRIHLEGNRDLNVDTSGIGNFGQVNSTANAPVTGGTGQPKFWDSKGGNILSSLLGIIGMGALGAGVGAVSGGGRGALNGLSYGMGFGALQDVALRKAAMSSEANEQKLTNDLMKAMQAGVPADAKMFGMYQQMSPDQQQAFQDYKLATNPYAGMGIDLRRQSVGIQQQNSDIARDKIALGLQQDSQNLQKLRGGLDNLFKAVESLPPDASRYAYSIPGAGHVSTLAGDIDASKSLILSNFSRFTGEKGVLTDQDIKRIEKALPSGLDTPKVVASKKKILQEYFDKVSSFSKSNVQQFSRTTAPTGPAGVPAQARPATPRGAAMPQAGAIEGPVDMTPEQAQELLRQLEEQEGMQ